MRGAITPFLRPKEAGHLPALKEEDKQYDSQGDVRKFQENRSSELTAYLFIFSFFFTRSARNTRNLLKQKQKNRMRGAITNKIGTSEVMNYLPFLPSEGGRTLARFERRRQTV
jgi:hypothetical protein